MQVSKSGFALLKGGAAGGHIPSRLGRSQPGSPVATMTAAMAAGSSALGNCAGDTLLLRDTAPLSSMRGLGACGAYAAGGPHATGVPQSQLRQQSRISLGSNTSSTPAGLVISPSVAALASKYATSSVGGSSVGGLSLPEQQSTGEAQAGVL